MKPLELQPFRMHLISFFPCFCNKVARINATKEMKVSNVKSESLKINAA